MSGAYKAPPLQHGPDEETGFYPITSFVPVAKLPSGSSLFDIVNTEGMRRRRCAEFDTPMQAHPGIRNGTKHALVIWLSDLDVVTSVMASISQLESLILAQNERWRHA